MNAVYGSNYCLTENNKEHTKTICGQIHGILFVSTANISDHEFKVFFWRARHCLESFEELSLAPSRDLWFVSRRCQLLDYTASSHLLMQRNTPGTGMLHLHIFTSRSSLCSPTFSYVSSGSVCPWGGLWETNIDCWTSWHAEQTLLHCQCFK